MDELKQAEVKVYLHPASITLQVEATISNASVVITDMTGKQVMQQEFSIESTIYISELKDGIYFVTFKKHDLSANKKKIIIHH